MTEKKITTRIQHKIDTYENWNKAVNFIPLKGEIIIYTTNENGNPEVKIKIGDGETNIRELKFLAGSGSATGGADIEAIQSDWAQEDTSALDYIKNKPEIITEVVENSNNLITSGGVFEALKNIPTDGGNSEGLVEQVQADWAQIDSTAVDYIKNKPVISNEIKKDSKNLVTSGSIYEALKNISLGGTVDSSVQSNWAQTDDTKLDYIKNKIGDTIDITKEDFRNYSIQLGNPSATSPFVLWAEVIENISNLLDIKDGISFRVYQNGTLVDETQLINHVILNSQFTPDGYVGYWGLINANQTADQILTTGVWTRKNVDYPTFVVGFIKSNVTNKVYINVGAPENLANQSFDLQLDFSETVKQVIGLPDNILGEEFKNIDGILTSAYGKTVLEETEDRKDYYVEGLNMPDATDPFAIWNLPSINGDQKMSEDTEIIISYTDSSGNLTELSTDLTLYPEISELFGFNIDEWTVCWGIVNAQQTIPEILSTGQWTKIDDSKPTIALMFGYSLENGKIYPRFASPELITNYSSNYGISFINKNVEIRTIKIPESALPFGEEVYVEFDWDRQFEIFWDGDTIGLPYAETSNKEKFYNFSSKFISQTDLKYTIFTVFYKDEVFRKLNGQSTRALKQNNIFTESCEILFAKDKESTDILYGYSILNPGTYTTSFGNVYFPAPGLYTQLFMINILVEGPINFSTYQDKLIPVDEYTSLYPIGIGITDPKYWVGTTLKIRDYFYSVTEKEYLITSSENLIELVPGLYLLEGGLIVNQIDNFSLDGLYIEKAGSYLMVSEDLEILKLSRINQIDKSLIPDKTIDEALKDSITAISSKGVYEALDGRNKLVFDTIPTQGSINLMTSGNIYQAIEDARPKDVSELGNSTGYQTANDVNNLIQNNYYTKTEIDAKAPQFDTEPTMDSNNLLTSGSIYEALSNISVGGGSILIPTKLSAFENDKGYITEDSIPTKLSAFENDKGYLTSIPSHTHSASDINSGTLSNDRLSTVSVEKGGTGYTSIVDTTYTTARYRASTLSKTEITPSSNGVISWTYE